MEGKRSVQREIAHHNLDMIISVGYRVIVLACFSYFPSLRLIAPEK